LILKKRITLLIAYTALLMSLTAHTAASDKAAVQTMLDNWQEAWQQRDFQNYLAFYDSNFRSGDLDYQNWMDDKKEQFKHAGTILLELSKMEISITENKAIASFLLQYQDIHISTIGDKILFLTHAKNGWKITGEQWKTLAGYVLLPNQTQSSAQSPSQNADGLIIKNIKFEIDSTHKENVLIQFNQFYTPKAFVLEKDRPRVVFDIKNLSAWNGPRSIAINGQLIKQIRTHFYADTGKLRIVLDLVPALNYVTDQTYFKKENIYRIELMEAK
jgi:hypothetical protein